MPDIVPLPPELCAPDDAPAMADVLRGDLVEAGTDLPSKWHIGDDRSAEWAMRMLVQIELKRSEVREQASRWMQEIVDWLERQDRSLARGVNYFDGQLRTYALARRAIDEDAKTLRLPSGDVNTTKTRPRLEITDGDALLGFLKAANRTELIRTKEEVQVSALKDAVKIEHGPALFSVSMDCGDTFEADSDDVRFCRVCGAEGAVMEVEQIVFEQWWPTLYGVVLPGVEVVPPSVSAKVVPK
jgi:hypothetical protein